MRTECVTFNAPFHILVSHGCVMMKKQSTLTAFFQSKPSEAETEQSTTPADTTSDADLTPVPTFAQALEIDAMATAAGAAQDTWLNIPTDRDTREEYTQRGPYRDAGEYVQTVIAGKRRSFQPAWYNGRVWLEYHKLKDAAFCFPCRIFGKTIYDSTFQREGFRQWNSALEKNRGFDKHSKSKEHVKIICCLGNNSSVRSQVTQY